MVNPAGLEETRHLLADGRSTCGRQDIQSQAYWGLMQAATIQIRMEALKIDHPDRGIS